MARLALISGSFDPITNSHLDVVRQAVRLADGLVMAIGTHPGKTPVFTVDERLAMIEAACGPVAEGRRLHAPLGDLRRPGCGCGAPGGRDLDDPRPARRGGFRPTRCRWPA